VYHFFKTDSTGLARILMSFPMESQKKYVNAKFPTIHFRLPIACKTAS